MGKKTKKLRIVFISVLIASVVSVFSGCFLLSWLFGGNGGLSAGKISFVDAVPGEKQGELYIVWYTGSLDNHTLYIDIEPDPDGSYPRQIGDTSGYVCLEGLNPGLTYTVTARTYDSNGSEYDSKEGKAYPDGSRVKTVNYIENVNDAIEVDDTTSILKLENVKDKQIMFANINVAPYSASNVKTMEWGTPRYVFKANSVDSNSRAVWDSVVDSSEAKKELPASGIKHFVPPVKDFRKVSTSLARSVAGAPSASVYDTYASTDTFDPSYPETNQTKTIWVDCNSDIDTFAPVKMKLRSIGKDGNGNIVCYVWASDDNYTTSSPYGNKVNAAICNEIAQKFVRHYKHEQAIFGETSNKVYKWVEDFNKNQDMEDDEISILNMNTNNRNTGNLVNIVIYDIGKDYGSNTGGVVGYFYAKDYYAKGGAYYTADIKSDGTTKNVLAATNEGKYFYIDAPFCNMDSKNTSGYTYNGTGHVSETVISTLFHEFQHMIDFGTKDMNDVEVTNDDHWFNEMLSMLAEDLMADQLGLSDSDDVVDKSRLPYFNSYYYYSGLAEYLSDSNYAVISYSTAYALGAYLVRNYGGVELVREMSTNDAYGLASIVKAIKKNHGLLHSGMEITEENILQEFVQAAAFRTAYSNANSTLPTMNHLTGSPFTTDYYGVESTSAYNTLTSRLNGINLFSVKYGWKESESSQRTYYGPLTFAMDKGTTTRPTGFLLHTVGKAKSDEVILYFTNNHAIDDRTWVYIQDDFSNSSPDTTPVKTEY